MKKDKFGICAFCGQESVVTDDHIPPRNIFPPPQPPEIELITVPGCKNCNHGSRIDDEEFKVYISLKSGLNGPAALKLHESTKRTVRKNNRIRSQILRNSTPLFLPGGHTGNFSRQIVHGFDPKPIRRVGRKIIKGLYFRHFGISLEGNADVSLYLAEDFRMSEMITVEDLAKDTGKFGRYHIVGSNHEFHYVYATTEVEFGTSWILVFNRASAMVGITIPTEDIQPLAGDPAR